MSELNGRQAAIDASVASTSEANDALQRVLSSPGFAASPRRKALLAYLAQQTLENPAVRLKEFSIGGAVFDRGGAFDPRLDPVVRLEARRLRHDLDAYYRGAGRADPVRILIPKGGYRTAFECQDIHAPANQEVSEAVSKTKFADPEVQPLPNSAPAPAEPVPSKATPSARPWWPSLVFGAATALVVFALTFRHELTTLLDGNLPPPAVPIAAAGHGPIVAIPAIRDSDSDANSSRFKEGFTQQLVGDLVRFDSLRVIAPSGAKEYDDGVNTLKNLRERLGVDYVLQGSQTQTKGDLRLALELTDTRTSQVVWATTFQQKLTPDDFSAAEKDISAKVAASIGSGYGVVLHSEILLAQPSLPKLFSSYDCVLQYYALVITFSASRHMQVRSCLEQTVKNEPSYASAWAVLANVYAQEYRFNLNARPDPAESLRLSLEAARRAVLLEPENPTARIMLALNAFDRRDFDEFRRNGDLAVALNPNDPDILGQYGMRLTLVGDWDRGETMTSKAMELSPAYPVWYGLAIALIRYQQGKYPEALEEIDKHANSNPNFIWYQVFLAMTYGQLELAADAASAKDAILHLRPDFREAFWPMARVWNVPDQQIENMAAGLRKAGLDVVRPGDDPPAIPK